MNLLAGLMIPFIGTSAGALTVFFMKNGLSPKVEKWLLGFASGVMMAASVWSLLLPSIEMAQNQGVIAWLPAAIGFLVGLCFLLILNRTVSRLCPNFCEAERDGRETADFKKMGMMMLAVTLHNIPEGMAVGVAFSGALMGSAGVTMAAAFALSVGIAIQNFPEGAIISLPLKSKGMRKPKAFTLGMLSGAVEPISAVITLLLTGAVEVMLPYLLSFAAAAMIYVVVGELIPEAQSGRHASLATVGVAAGFVIMMILDVALG